MKFYRSNLKIYLSSTILLLSHLYSYSQDEDPFWKHAHDTNYYQTWTPPNGIKISTNLFYDQTEITNSNWREYSYWTMRTYGSNSAEYKSTLLDTLVWANKTHWLWRYVKYYLRHPYYNDYPVVGVSQKQINDFTKWRTDRVMEFLLIQNKEIPWDSTRKLDFTIEKYYSGKYLNIKPNPRFRYYPSFRVPTILEWKKALRYADSIAKTVCKDSIPNFRSDINPNMQDTLGQDDPTENVYVGCKNVDSTQIYNLRGNVGEWVSQPGISVGGGWIDKRQVILTQDTFHVSKPNAWTGFRNVCEWREWPLK